MADPTNSELAAALDELGDLYELDGAIVHRVVAYRNAAKAVREAPTSVARLVREGRARELPGIGATLAEKLFTYVESGSIPALERLRATHPAGVVAMTKLAGIGPRRARRLHDELGIDTLDALRAACESGRVQGLAGFGERAQARILAALDERRRRPRAARVTLPAALEAAEPILAELRRRPAVERAELAGSVRRGVDAVKDIDIAVASRDPSAVVRALADLGSIAAVESAGASGVRAIAHSGLPVELRIVAPESFGSLLQHLTGSREHNVRLRELAVRRGLRVSEHGILDESTGETTLCADEADVYARLDLPLLPPELREGRGELEEGFAAPTLIERSDLRGDLHCHTVASDGRATIEEMALAARELGHEYLAITDHSASHGFGNEVSPQALLRQIAAVRACDERVEGIRLLAGSEVSILPDGSLDYDDDLLARLDWVVASVHSSLRMEEAPMTARLLRAARHPLVDAIGHPTGRLIGRRGPSALDVEALIDAAARTGTFLEINGAPDRRDLDERHAAAAAERGVRLVLASDAHRPATLANQRWALLTARRARLARGNVANTLRWEELEPLRPRHRAR